eukprot:gb/GECH01011539.1/.p1 GENE.gb/GECH01011539.1/~~gb/GECH01011539.1/.p1  ORF type:complete len:452 (+),score=126.35 gb/GECH01011539.1/:1-1356(+)
MRPIRNISRSSFRTVSKNSGVGRTLKRGINLKLENNEFSHKGIHTSSRISLLQSNNLPLKHNQIKLSTRNYSSEAGEIVKVPSMGESISEGTIQEFLKNEGDYVEADEVVVQIETDKTVNDVRAPSAGVLKKLFASAGDDIEVDQDLFSLDTTAERPAGGAQKSEEKPAQTESKSEPKQQEQAQKPAKEAPKEESKPAAKGAPSQSETQPAGSARAGTEGLERRVKMSRMRQRIAQRLKDSQNTYAMLTTFNEVDMSALMNLRSEYKEAFQEKHGIKLGFMSAFVKAATVALQHVPSVNAVIDGDEIVYRDYCDVGVAVATPTGLVVPVLRNCQDKSFAQVETEISDYGKKARDNRISLEDMQGGTFTISNGGVFGSLMGTPIINPPQSAILGMHATKKRPVAVGDRVEVRPMMYLALTYDHRLIDGKDAVTFLVKLKECIEDPRRLLLDL